jgi:hypothetical protein
METITYAQKGLRPLSYENTGASPDLESTGRGLEESANAAAETALALGDGIAVAPQPPLRLVARPRRARLSCANTNALRIALSL